jgi:putative transposase
LPIRLIIFCARLKNSLSTRAREDRCQTELVLTAWQKSGKVYGYRKLHDDLLNQGEACCANRVARLARQLGIKALIGNKRRPGTFGAKPSVIVDNTLNRQFEVDTPDPAWVADITYIRTLEGFAYLAGELLPAGEPQNQHRAVRHSLQSSTLTRKPQQTGTC